MYNNYEMKRKIIFALTFLCLIIAGIFALGFGAGITGLVAGDATQEITINQIFSASFLFLGLGIFIVGLLHD